MSTIMEQIDKREAARLKRQARKEEKERLEGLRSGVQDLLDNLQEASVDLFEPEGRDPKRLDIDSQGSLHEFVADAASGDYWTKGSMEEIWQALDDIDCEAEEQLGVLEHRRHMIELARKELLAREEMGNRLIDFEAAARRKGGYVRPNGVIVPGFEDDTEL